MESMPNPVHSGNGSMVMSGTGTPVTSRFGRASAPIEERTLTDRPMPQMPMAQMITQQMVPHEDIRTRPIIVTRGGTNPLPWWPVPPRMQTEIMPWKPLMYPDAGEPDPLDKLLEAIRR